MLNAGDMADFQLPADSLRRADAFATIFDGFEHGGLTARVVSKEQVSPPGSLPPQRAGSIVLSEVVGDITDPERATTSKIAGSFARRVVLAEDGSLYVYHDSLTLKKQYQGRGFATAFNRRAQAAYMAGGIPEIRVSTDAVGGYAWARAGFEFNDDNYGLMAAIEFGGGDSDLMKDERFGRAAGAWKLYQQRYLGQSFAAQKSYGDVPDDLWDGFLDRFPKAEDLEAYARGQADALDGKLTRPSEIAMFGHEHTWIEEHDPTWQGQEMWLGKRFLLGSQWKGRKMLDQGKLYEAKGETLVEIYDEFEQAGKLHDPADGIAGDADLEFWAEVARRV
jgi:hypothetical protein